MRMKIVHSKVDNNLVPIESLSVGDCFRNLESGLPHEIYQRIELDSGIMMMNLRTGLPAYFSMSDRVRPVVTTLTWEDS